MDTTLGLILAMGLIAFLLTFRLPPSDPPPSVTATRPPMIRRLHLVRPDLIPFPLPEHEVYA